MIVWQLSGEALEASRRNVAKFSRPLESSIPDSGKPKRDKYLLNTHRAHAPGSRTYQVLSKYLCLEKPGLGGLLTYERTGKGFKFLPSGKLSSKAKALLQRHRRLVQTETLGKGLSPEAEQGRVAGRQSSSLGRQLRKWQAVEEERREKGRGRGAGPEVLLGEKRPGDRAGQAQEQQGEPHGEAEAEGRRRDRRGSAPWRLPVSPTPPRAALL